MTSLGAETLFTVLGQRITNTAVTTLLVDGVVLGLVFGLRSRLKETPGTFQTMAESLVEYLNGMVGQVGGSRSPRIFPWVAAFFIFIAISNLLGLLPGVGTIGFFHRAGEGTGLVPLFHPNTSDLNQTLALAIVSVFATHVIAIRSTGVKDYLRRFFSLSPILLFVGILEIVQELVKFVSFSFRLFGNITGGHIVLGTMSSLFAFVVPVPFLALEILVAVVQAGIFAMLTMAFMAILSEPHKKEESH
jgi:F-type H+-transporting ATPase subunit a